MKINKKTLINKIVAVLCMFVFAVAALALPSTTSTNLQTTAGVNLTTQGNTLNVSSPHGAVLNWQRFGSGTDTITNGERVEFNLPTNQASVLNIVNVGSSTIDGTISSNGKVFILNPNGIVVGAQGRIDTNGLHLSTVDDPTSALLYWSSTGTLQSANGVASGNSTNGVVISDGASLRSPNIVITSRAIDVQGGVVAGNLALHSFGGNVSVGSSQNRATTIQGGLDVVTSGGNVRLAPNGALIVQENIVINTVGTTLVGNVTQGSGHINAKGMTVTGNVVSLNTVNITGTGGVVTIIGGNTTGNNSTGNNSTGGNSTGGNSTGGNSTGGNSTGGNSTGGNSTGGNSTGGNSTGGNVTTTNSTNSGFITISGVDVFLANITNSGTDTLTVNGSNSVTFGGGVKLESAGVTTITSARISDTLDGIFVYGPIFFNTTGDLSITKSGHNFGSVNINAGGNAIITESSILNLNSVQVGGSLLAISQNAEVVQFLPNSKVLAQNATVNGKLGVYLTNPQNSITGVFTSNSEGNITVNQSRGLLVGNVSAGGVLTIDTTTVVASPVIQVGGTSVDAKGGLTVRTTNGEVSFMQNNNNFGGVTISAGSSAVGLTELAATRLVALNAGTTLVRSGGNITHTPNATSTVGPLTLISGGTITLTDQIKTSALSFSAVGITDLSQLSFAYNLSGVYPTNLGTGTFLPPKP